MLCFKAEQRAACTAPGLGCWSQWQLSSAVACRCCAQSTAAQRHHPGRWVVQAQADGCLLPSCCHCATLQLPSGAWHAGVAPQQPPCLSHHLLRARLTAVSCSCSRKRAAMWGGGLRTLSHSTPPSPVVVPLWSQRRPAVCRPSPPYGAAHAIWFGSILCETMALKQCTTRLELVGKV